MKKSILLFVVLALGSVLNAQISFSVTAQSCYNATGPNTIIATVVSSTLGANNFSWTVNGASCQGSVVATYSAGAGAILQYGCCGVQTITVKGYQNSNYVDSTNMVVNLQCPPAISISALSSTALCAGMSNTLQGWGAMSYTWMPGNIGNALLVTNPAASTCYTLFGSGTNGCTSSLTSCQVVTPGPTLGVTQSVPFLCAGQSAIITATGAASYSWNTGANTASILVTPSVSTCYSLYAGTNGCVDSAVVCMPVFIPPTVSVSATPTLCQGGVALLLAGGANSYTWNPGSLPGGTFTTMVNATTIWTLQASDGTCSVTHTALTLVSPAPVLSVAGNTTMCKGSSTTLTVTGAPSLFWPHNSATTATMNVMPPVYSIYTVTGTDALGCSKSELIAIQPDTTCAIVWPGDANSDGIVNSNDVLELGLYANSSGAARSPGGNNYSGQYATAWTGNGSNSQNRAHVDCNGDGTVDAGDTLAISLNWNQSHAFKNAGSSVSGEDLTLVPATSGAGNVGWNTVDIILGSVSNNISDIYGITFDLTYDASFVDNDQVHVRYPSSFLSAGNTNIPFRRVDAGAAVINCVSVRTDGNQVSGNGKIGEFLFKHNGSKLGEMTFSASNVKMIDAGGMVTDLTGGSGTALFLHLGLEAQAGSAKIAVYPNPASGSVIFKSGNSTELSYKVADLTGRLISEGTFKGETKIDVSAFAAGTYMVSFEGEGLREVRRLIKE